MDFANELLPIDRELADAKLRDFVPSEVFDIHAHPFNPAVLAPGALPYLANQSILGSAQHRAALARYIFAPTIHGLYFGLPHQTADRPACNAWLREDLQTHGTPLSRALLLVSPQDPPDLVASELRSGRFCGLKVYHYYTSRPDTMNAGIAEFAPDWMWELLHETRGILMLHLVRDGAIADPGNQTDLRRFCKAYPNARLILAHIARSFNYRNARSGLHTIADLDNAVVDTSAVCEAEAFEVALRILGPQRVLFGSDFPISEAHGRCVTTANSFLWVYADTAQKDRQTATAKDMTLIGIESLLSLREACEDFGASEGDLQDIFRRNALRILEPHLPQAARLAQADGPALWQHARSVISGGTGLLSKRAEMFDPRGWPAYFSRCSGCEVWDLSQRRYLDFVGGIGAVLLGYADPDVTAAVQRRLSLGTYCSLVNPQEVELADRLLALHPWAQKVRYARGGGEAMAIAVRTARAATGRSGIAFCGYHGWHDWYLAANLSANDALDGHLLPGLEPRGVPRELLGTSVPFRYNDLASLDKALDQLKNNLAAVVMEPMRSQWPVDNFVAKVAERCRAAGAVFVVDEVSSGLRYGFPGAWETLFAPGTREPANRRSVPQLDLVIYAKALSNGFPFGVVIGREAVMSTADASFISSSYWTDGMGPAAALAVLEKAQRLQVHEQIWDAGVSFQKGLKEVSARYPACRVNIGGMPPTTTIHFDLGSQTSEAKGFYVRKMQERGILASSVIYLMLAHEPEHRDQFIAAVSQTLAELESVIASGRLVEDSGAPPAQAPFVRLA